MSLQQLSLNIFVAEAEISKNHKIVYINRHIQISDLYLSNRLL